MKLWIKNILQNIINKIESEEDETLPEDYFKEFMIGDLILLIKRLWKHNTCVHKYIVTHCGPDYHYLKCRKCGKVSHNFDLV